MPRLRPVSSGMVPADGESIFGIPRLRPMLASVAKEPFDDDNWLFEVKWDGYRCLAYISGEDVYLDSRNGKPLLTQFPALSRLPVSFEGQKALIDGEIVAFSSGHVDFSYLRTNPKSVTFVAFDVLFLDGRMLIDRPLSERKGELSRVMRAGGPASLSEAVERQGKAMFDWAKENDLEGIMAKRKDSLYAPGERTASWLKVKNVREDRFWVLGYVSSPGRTLGSLVVAERDDNGYTVVGRVSSGLNREYERQLTERLEPVSFEGLLAQSGVIRAAPSRRELQKIRWVKPYFGVEVNFTEMTSDGKLRHPVFKNLVNGRAGDTHAY